MMAPLKRVLSEDGGEVVMAYALAVGLIAAAAIAGMDVYSASLDDLFDTIGGAMSVSVSVG